MNPILPILITRIIDDTTTNHSNVDINQKPNTENIEFNDVFDNSIYEMNENKKKEDDKEFFKNFKIIAYGIGLTIFIITMIITHFIPKSNSYQNTESVANLVIYKLHIAQFVTFGFLITFIMIFALISIIKKIRNK